MRANTTRAWLLPVIASCHLLAVGARAQNATSVQARHEPITQQLIALAERDPELAKLLARSIEMAKRVNPDKATNPAQTVEAYYAFIDWAAKAMPWSVLPNVPRAKLYDQIDQGLSYFYFLNDQPLPELKDKGYFHNSLQYYGPYRAWLTDFVKKWGLSLSEKDSWNAAYYQRARDDARFGLREGWYEDPANWKTFNDFFSRRLKSPDQRPIASPNDPSIVSSPVDSVPQGVWAIDAKSTIAPPTGVPLKSGVIISIAALIGEESAYKNAFAGGALTFAYLDEYDYHRCHFPVAGTIKEVRVIPGSAVSGGVITWNAAAKRYMFDARVPGWQGLETRGLVIVETEKHGLIALLPVGMAQMSSVHFEETVKVGGKAGKGDNLGYFLFGGSGMVMIFQPAADFKLTARRNADGSYKHILTGEEYGRLAPK